jgi:hypothetical protein
VGGSSLQAWKMSMCPGQIFKMDKRVLTFVTNPSHIGFSAPSAVMPLQRNLILHPGYPMFQRFVKLTDVREVRPDARLLV